MSISADFTLATELYLFLCVNCAVVVCCSCCWRLLFVFGVSRPEHSRGAEPCYPQPARHSGLPLVHEHRWEHYTFILCSPPPSTTNHSQSPPRSLPPYIIMGAGWPVKDTAFSVWPVLHVWQSWKHKVSGFSLLQPWPKSYFLFVLNSLSLFLR